MLAKLKNLLDKIWRMAFFSREMPCVKWSTMAVGVVLAVLLVWALLVIAIDPYLHYRKAGVVPAAFTQPYWQIAGVLKFYDFDTVIVGSSTAQNFDLKLFREKLGMNPVKATASACYTHSGCAFADTAMKFHPELKTIIYGLDLFIFFEDADYEKQTLPDFLYSGRYNQDYCYWWNWDMFHTYLKDLRKVYLGKYGSCQYTNPDLMFAGKYEEDLRDHGVRDVASAFRKGHFRPALLAEKLTDAECMARFQNNVEKNLVPLVERYPEVTFIFYLSPASALNFADAENGGRLELLFALRNMLAERLLAHPNVVFHDFQIAPETLEIENYKDLIHYVPGVNDQMVEWLQTGQYQVHALEEVAEHNKILARYAKESMAQLQKIHQLSGVPRPTLPRKQKP